MSSLGASHKQRDQPNATSMHISEVACDVRIISRASVAWTLTLASRVQHLPRSRCRRATVLPSRWQGPNMHTRGATDATACGAMALSSPPPHGADPVAVCRGCVECTRNINLVTSTQVDVSSARRRHCAARKLTRLGWASPRPRCPTRRCDDGSPHIWARCCHAR